jgi:hypothetical protein
LTGDLAVRARNAAKRNSQELLCCVTDTKESDTWQKTREEGAPDSLGLGKQYSRLSVTQYTSAREVSGIFVALFKFTLEQVDACIGVA